jgi:predicted Zn-dependent protease
MRMQTPRWITAILAAAIVFGCSAALMAKDFDIDYEKKLGQEGAKSADTSLKFVKDEKYTKRVETIGQKVAAIARVTKVKAIYGAPDLADFTYTFKVVDDKDVNAFSLPGGYIYVNKGLLDQVDSDDELAAVIAHEAAHVAHHHMYKLIKKQSSLDGMMFLLIAGMVIGKVQGADMQNIFYGAKLVEVAKLNNYSQKAENDADTTAIQYLIKGNYNPVGMLTFMEKLAYKEEFDPNAQEQTVVTDHPPSKERAKSIRDQLQKYNVPINRRTVSLGNQALVTEATVGDKKVSEVTIGGRAIFRPSDSPTETSAARAKAIADSINRQLAADPQPYEVKAGGTAVYIKGTMVLNVLQQDADLAGGSPDAVATKAKNAIQAALASYRMIHAY